MSKLQIKPETNFKVNYEIDKSFDNESFIKLRLRVCHDGISPNKTYFTKETLENAKETIKNKPILAHVKYDKDDESDTPVLGSHDYHIEKDRLNDGEYRVIYDETPIGVIPETCNFTIEEFEGLNYAFVDAFIYRDYSNYAEQLIEQAVNVKLSMEITIPNDKISYNAKEKYWDISEFKFRGITLLNEDLGTGMKNALATTENFSQEKEEDIKSKMVILMDTLNECLFNYNKNLEEGSKELTKFEELLQKYNVSKEDLTFEYAELSDDELEAKFVEIFDTEDTKIEDTKEPTVEDDFAITKTDTFSKIFALSHDDVRSGLYVLLQKYEEMDETYYYIQEVFDTHFVYRGWENSQAKIYRQDYKKVEDSLSFENERIELFQELLTASEKAELETLRADYALLQSFKSEYEKVQKEAILDSDRYSILEENDNFKTLRENIEKYTLEEVEKECKIIFADHVLNIGEFSLKNKEPETSKLKFEINQEKEKKPYGGYFEKYK